MAEMEKYFVSEACIACDACCDDFPDIFTMNADHTRAMAMSPAPVGKHNPWDIVLVCPVDAISLTNMPMPPKPEGAEAPAAEAIPAPLVDWRKRWEAARNQPESQWERMKRYGMASTLEDEGDRYELYFEMPETVPNHELKFKWDLPDKMPDYAYKVEIQDHRVVVRAKIQDEKIKKLSGWINSFPMGFQREILLESPVQSHKEKYDAEKRVLQITLEKAVVH